MIMNEMEKWQRSSDRANKAQKKAKLRRQDIQDLKDAGIWDDPRTRYLDEYGYVLPNAPQWWINLRKAWTTNDQKNAKRKADRPFKSNEPKQVAAPMKRYEKVDRKPKLKHSEKMRLLLKEHGIPVTDDDMLSDEFSEWRFCKNGRVQRGYESTISVFYFLQHHADT